ncbi:MULTISPECIES: hypothetical protein [Variovorax]|uniref:hypothetical protein n=1 Tax=Variovorax TaxID=34072 RepID=UPI0012F9C7E5|nr:hypothetical protein [Variovorax boronicumulans]
MPHRRAIRVLGAVLVAAGLLPLLLPMETLSMWLVLPCIASIFAGSALLCGAWELLSIRRREARSRGFDAQAQGVIVGSEVGGAYSDTSPLMNLTVRFADRDGVERQVVVQKVVMLNELPLYAMGRPVLVRFASASPTTELVISPIVAPGGFSF